MKKELERLCEICKESILDAAHDSYRQNGGCDFVGCQSLIKLSEEKFDVIELNCYESGEIEVLICHKHNEYKNIERYIEKYICANADVFGAWQEAYDNDDDDDCDPGCDPAFPHYGDFERWAYGR